MAIFEHTANDGTGNDSTEGRSLGWTAADAPAEDVIFDVLRNERRRRVLRYLDEADGAVDIGELAEALAERESDDGTYDHRDRKRTYVSLYQTHLPKMDDVGIVEYDRRSKRVRLAPGFDRVEPYLYDRRDTSVRWHRMYLAAGLFGVGIVTPGYLLSSSTALIPEMVWVGILAGICCFLVAAHLVFSTEWIDAGWLREER